MDVTEDGVALPAVGVSVFGVDVRRKVVGALRDRGDCTAAVDGVLDGSGGNAAAATAGFPGVAGPTGVLAADFTGTDILRPAADRLSAAFIVVWVICVPLPD